MRDTFVKTMMEIAKDNEDMYLITGDLGFGVLKPYWEAFPERFINAGIAEQAMTGIAAGLALEGKIVTTYSIGNFPTLRCLEQIRNDCAYHEVNVKIVCIGGGFAYGALGMSHHATEDIAIMRSLPDVVVLTPGDLMEAKAATRAMYEYHGTCYLRLGRGGERQIHDKELTDFKIGKAIKIKDGEKIAILSAGGILDEAADSVEKLREMGINAAQYSFPTVKPIDTDTIQSIAKEFELIVTVEEHNIVGGFGSAVAEVISELDEKRGKLVRIGIPDVYSSIVGDQKYLREVYGVSSDKIVERILKEVNRN